MAVFPLFCAHGNAGSELNWKSFSGYRCAELNPHSGSKPAFFSFNPAETGIQFTNGLAASRHLTNQILLNGSGVAAGDVDGDGWCDIFLGGLNGRSELYRNLGGWKFEKRTAAIGINLSQLDASGAALTDFDGDEDLDLIVNSFGQGTHCFVNDGQGRFTPSPRSPVLNPGLGGSSLALADMDADGDLDLYIANYRTTTIRDEPNPRFTIKPVNGKPQIVAVNGRPLTHPDNTNRFHFHYRPTAGGGVSVLHDEMGEADALYLNDGRGGFTPVSFTDGRFLDEAGKSLTTPPFDWGLSVMLRDLDGDGAPDIYVCNDFSTPDRIWLNTGQGQFRAGPAPAIRQTSLSTMSIDIADVNRDGWDDIFTADMLSREPGRRLIQKNEPNPFMHLFVDLTSRPQFPRNMLQLNRGDGTYAEIAQMAGIEASEWTWTPAFLDVDLDGFEDLLVVNGFERDYMNMDANRQIGEMRMRGGRRMSSAEQLELNRIYPRLATGNLAFRNQGNLRFSEVSAQWAFDMKGVSQGMCLADLDNDGDLDIVINNLNGPAYLLRNESPAPRVAVRLRGKSPNTKGIGARIKLYNGAVPIQTQEMICGGRYLSSDEAMRVFAAGSSTQRMILDVHWRSGLRSIIPHVLPNHLYEVDESLATPGGRPAEFPRNRPQFSDASALIGHTHRPTSFNDFVRQPLLSKKLSQAGPGVSWFDVDQDGWDDLILGEATGASVSIFQNEKGIRFRRMDNRIVKPQVNGYLSTILGWTDTQGRRSFLLGANYYESQAATNPVAFHRNFSGESLSAALPASSSASGPMCLADVDGDGSLEWFIGGQCIPGRWPEPAASMLLRRSGGDWIIDSSNLALLNSVGLVNGAVFTDLDADGDPDLVLACDWGPLRVFLNTSGKLSEATVRFGLDTYQGWWNGIASGDFDGDGQLDLAAANWGRNTKYEAFRQQPLRLYYGDFNGDGQMAILESCFDPSRERYVSALPLWTLAQSLPWLRVEFESNENFSQAAIMDILGDRQTTAQLLEANWLDTTVFLNRGDHFEPRPLPVEAQMAPVFGIAAADFNGDGREDLFLSQNFFAVRPETSRYDAGRGLLLHGLGNGGFKPVAGRESGIVVYGEQRGTAVADYDQDGRADLVVTQSGGDTKLYHNDTAKPGIRIRLEGPPENPLGIGATIRIRSNGTWGPTREIQAGSGYWSQNSAAQVMALAAGSESLWIRWPGGKITQADLPGKALEIWVTATGKLKVIR